MSPLTINGLQYEIDVEGSGPPLVLLHGFTGSRESWGTIEPSLSMDHTVIAIDLLGHGGTAAPAEPDRYGVDHQVADLAQLWAVLSLEQAAVVGYSMGARLALAFAVRYPALVDQLILISGGAGIRDPHERAMRSRSDELLAGRIETFGIEDFVKEWEALPLWESQRDVDLVILERQREIRLRQRPTGLAQSLRGFGQGSQPALWDALPTLNIPVLILAGAEDSKYASLALEMAPLLPDATAVILPGAGHAVHLEKPEAVSMLIGEFLAKQRAVVS